MLVYTVGEIFMKENILPRERNCEKQFHPLHMHANDILNCLLLALANGFHPFFWQNNLAKYSFRIYEMWVKFHKWIGQGAAFY